MVWLVMPVLQVSDSVLACLALRAFLVVSMLMLQSESIISCWCCTTSSTVMFSSAGDFWKTIGLLALIVFSGVSCCFVAFPVTVACAKHACMLPGLGVYLLWSGGANLQLAVLLVVFCCMPASFLSWCTLPVFLILFSPCSQGSSLPAHLGFLCIFPCIFVLVCRLGSELPVRCSLVIAAFLDCLCPFPVAWMSGLSGTSMGLWAFVCHLLAASLFTSLCMRSCMSHIGLACPSDLPS